MGGEYHRFFMSNEWSIPDNVEQRNALLCLKNLLVVHGKGRPSNKRNKSAGELTDKSNNKKRKADKADESANNDLSENISFDNCEPIYITQNI
ncbi:unnamed protein product [Rhizophagus irregularis]|nr:unnamed protein product [Rhizophagus irregularis]